MKVKTKDRCNICGWLGDSDLVPYNKDTKTWHCPQCNSTDMDDESADPYQEEEDDEMEY